MLIISYSNSQKPKLWKKANNQAQSMVIHSLCSHKGVSQLPMFRKTQQVAGLKLIWKVSKQLITVLITS